MLLGIARLSTGSGNPLSREEYSILLPRLLPGALFYGSVGLLLLPRRRWVGLLVEISRSLRRTIAQGVGAAIRMVRCESRWHLLWLMLIGVIGIALRVLYMGEPPRYDEAFTYIELAKRSLVHVFAYYPAPNNHILHTALVWISCRIFGNSLWALRLAAFCAGVALIPLMYVAGRQMCGRDAGLLAAGLMAVSGPFVLYSVNARGYTFQAVLLLIMLYAAVRIVAGAPNPLAYWVLFSIGAIAGFWIAPSMLYPYLVAAGFVLWAGGVRLFRPLFFSAAAIGVVVAALYMPVVIISGPDPLLRNPWIQPLPAPEFRVEALRFPSDLARLLHGSDPLPFAAVVVLGAILSFVFIPRAGKRWAHPLVLLLLVVLILPAVQRVVPFPRVLLPLFTIYYLSAAIGWCGLARRVLVWRERPAVVVFLALLPFLVFHLIRSGYIQSWREFPDGPAVANYLATHLRPSDRLLVTLSAGAELLWELDHAGVLYVQYSMPKSKPGRLVVATEYSRVPRVRGNGLIDPSQLTVEGTLREAGVDEAAYTPPRLIFRSGRGEVFELLPRPATSTAGVQEIYPP